MIPEEQIKQRLSDVNIDILFWADELKKELSNHKDWQDEGYITHCRVTISEFRSEKNTLIWVLGDLSLQTQPA